MRHRGVKTFFGSSLGGSMVWQYSLEFVYNEHRTSVICINSEHSLQQHSLTLRISVEFL